MTFEAYIDMVYNHKPKDQREGQWAMNCLPSNIYQMITNTDKDIFYLDKFKDDQQGVKIFLDYVAGNWHKSY